MIGIANGAAPAICTERKDENETSSDFVAKCALSGCAFFPVFNSRAPRLSGQMGHQKAASVLSAREFQSATQK